MTPRESDTIISAAAGTNEGNQELRSRSELTAKEVMREVGLGGEIRHVGHMSRRLAEAARLGFTRAIVPANSQPKGSGKAHAGLTIQVAGALTCQACARERDTIRRAARRVGRRGCR